MEFLTIGNTDHPPVKLKGGEHYDSLIKLAYAQQPTYGLFNGNKDAICIGYIAQTWPDKQEFAWLGSWGKQCGQPWYYSGIGYAESDEVCTWLDEDGAATDVMGTFRSSKPTAMANMKRMQISKS